MSDTDRTTAYGAEKLIGKQFPVLDDGFVRLIDYMGSDESIVQAARISYGKGTKSVSEDQGLINYLMRNRHTSPFEMCEFKFHVRVPMDTWRQWIRHRTASVNEYSTRYSEAIDSMQRTKPDEWRKQATDNKQGSAGFIGTDNLDTPNGQELTMIERIIQDEATRVYKERIASGVAREQARKDLPLSTYTEAYWKIDLHNLLHFLKLRMDKHAQFEIRQYANVIAKIVQAVCPLTWNAFEEYVLNSVQLSQSEILALVYHLGGGVHEGFDTRISKEILVSLEKMKAIAVKSRISEDIISNFDKKVIDTL